MKLTTKKLYQLIQEAMGEAQYGRDFASFLQVPIRTYMNQDDSLDIGYLEMHIGEKIGSGYSRMVFEIDDDHVAKLAYKHEDAIGDPFTEGCKSNRMEYLRFNKHPHCFPKSYGIFKNDSVLVVEKVNVISEQDHMDRVLRNCFPTLVESAAYLQKQGYEKINPSWIFERILDTWDEVIQPFSLVTPMEDRPEPEPVIRRDEFDVNLSWGRTKGMDTNILEDLWNIVTADSKLMSWVSSLRQIGVEFDEIRVGNVATNKQDNKLILIDISKFDFNSGTEIDKSTPRGIQHSKMSNVPYDNRTKNIETDPDYEKVRVGQWRKRMNESLRDDHKEKLIKLLLSDIENATMAIELMKGLDIPEDEIFDMIVKILPQVTNIPLRRFLSQQINFYLGRMSGLYDL